MSLVGKNNWALYLGLKPCFLNWHFDCSDQLRCLSIGVTNRSRSNEIPKAVPVENILILDDPATSHRITTLLRFHDCSILEAATGLKAIEIGRRCKRLSLFVVDIDFPDLSGTSVALALSRLFPLMPILFMSDNAIAYWKKLDSNLRRFNSNLVDFIEKPLSVAELKMRVQNLIGLKTQGRIGKENQGKQAA